MTITNTVTKTERWVDADAVAAHFGVSRRHIFVLLHEGLPSSKLGNSRRFLLSECDEWARLQHQPLDRNAIQTTESRTP